MADFQQQRHQQQRGTASRDLHAPNDPALCDRHQSEQQDGTGCRLVERRLLERVGAGKGGIVREDGEPHPAGNRRGQHVADAEYQGHPRPRLGAAAQANESGEERVANSRKRQRQVEIDRLVVTPGRQQREEAEDGWYREGERLSLPERQRQRDRGVHGEQQGHLAFRIRRREEDEEADAQRDQVAVQAHLRPPPARRRHDRRDAKREAEERQR